MYNNINNSSGPYVLHQDVFKHNDGEPAPPYRISYEKNQLVIEKYHSEWVAVASFTCTRHVRRVQVSRHKPRILFEYKDEDYPNVIHTTVVEKSQNDQWNEVNRFCDSRLVSCPYSQSTLSEPGNILLYSNTREGYCENRLASGQLTWITETNKGILTVQSSLPLGLGVSVDINAREDTIVATSLRTKPETGNRIFLFKKDQNGIFRMHREVEDVYPKHSEELTVHARFVPNTDNLIVKERTVFV